MCSPLVGEINHTTTYTNNSFEQIMLVLPLLPLKFQVNALKPYCFTISFSSVFRATRILFLIQFHEIQLREFW